MANLRGYKKMKSKKKFKRQNYYVRFGSRKYSYGELARKAFNGVRMLKGIVNAEKHYSDVQIQSTTNVTSSGAVYLINQVAMGDDNFNRTGTSILCKYIKVNIDMYMAAAATANQVRFIVFMDTANQGSTPSVTDFLQNATTVSFKNIDNQTRFTTLRDFKLWLSTGGKATAHRELYIPINQHLKYSSSGATDVLQNAIYLLAISDATSNYPTANTQVRTVFYDN